MKKIVIAILGIFIAGCSSKNADEFTTVKVQEVEQVGSYTYMLVKEKGPAYWIAVSSMEASPGETYHYQGGLSMEEFYSKELDRTFDEVIFIDLLIPGPYKPGTREEEVPDAEEEFSYDAMVTIEKKDVEVTAVEGTISLSELFANPSAYEGKSIRVRGEVTKFNAAIMERNWVHIQDGTEHEGKFDLTATTIESFKVGDVVTFEGILALNKDFGYGYSYELLLEKATAVE
jgi:hypothetical protein